jgi:hypothetical protein
MKNSTPGAESMSSVLKAMQDYMPGVISEISKVQPEVARSQAEIDAAVSPIYAQSQTDLYRQFGPELNRIGNTIESENQLASSQRELDIANRYGGDLVTSADNLQRILDPEYYAGKAAVGKGVTDLMGSMDPTQLSGSERAEVERSVGRSGAVNPMSSANTAANAMTFGSALQNKQANFANALGIAGQSITPLKSNVNAFEIATRRALTPNTGGQQFTGVQQNTGQNAWNTGNNFMNQASQLQQTRNQAQKSPLDLVTSLGGMFNFS